MSTEVLPVTARTRERPTVPVRTRDRTQAQTVAATLDVMMPATANLDSYATPERKRTFLAALNASYGNVTEACEASGIASSVHYYWMERDEDYRRAIIALEQKMLDFAEGQMRKNIQAGKEASLIFYLKTKGRARGYVERHEVTGPDGRPMQIEGRITNEQAREELPFDALMQVLARTVFKGATIIPPDPKPVKGRVVPQ